MTEIGTLHSAELTHDARSEAGVMDWEALRSQALTRGKILAMVSRCAQSQKAVEPLLEEVAQITAVTFGADLLMVCEVDAAGEVLGMRTRKPWDPAPQSGVSGQRLQPDRSALGFAMAAEEVVLIADLATESRFRDARLTRERIRSGIACGVRYGAHAYGALGVFFLKPCTPTEEDAALMQSICLLLGPAIAHREVENLLARERQLLVAAMESVESLVLLLDEEGHILRINGAAQRIGGFQFTEIRQRSFCSAFLLPEEAALVHDAMLRLRNGEPNPKCETFLLTKHGERRRISWCFAQVPSPPVSEFAMIVSGIDITDQHEAEIKLLELEFAAQAAGKGATPTHAHAAPSLQSQVSRVLQHERRKFVRHSYPCFQAIGPCYDDQIPRLDQFRKVRCRDISPGGFSFITVEPPDFRELVVAFGQSQNRYFLRARVVHVSPYNHEGADCFLVGCKYLGRFEFP